MERDQRGKSVRETYDRIAAHFAKTREYAWPEVESFVRDRGSEAPGSRALDLGCGNGRHAELLCEHGFEVTGIDVSEGLLGEAKERGRERGFASGVEWVQADAAALPIRSGVVDLGLYVATLHHLAPRDVRVASLSELARVLGSEGRALVSAWSTDHDRFDASEGFDTTVDWTLPGGETVTRYYHIYDPGEFETDLAESELSVIESEVSSGNCYAVVRGEE
ncbi:class I SAM-dependent methyltransferase [Natronorarus salvus]|uniref:class I SAM-dependent methyltransferase n=1 Tax=Natronorarus salvus TaxID=3117733 RepID=UPI002F26846E